MTCIIAKVVEGVVHMAGDKLGSNGYTGTISQRPKIFIKGEFLIGYTTSFRMGQLLEFSWSPPEKMESQSIDTYIYKYIVDSIKKVLTSDGFAEDTRGGAFLFGYQGKLFSMQADFSIFEVEDIAAVGCGADMALASLFTISNVALKNTMSVEEQLALSIKTAAARMVGVSTCYDYLTL